jgi:hypothetical protein
VTTERTLSFMLFPKDTPQHESEIFILSGGSSFGFRTIEPQFVKVYYDWWEVDEDGDHTGVQIQYEPNGEIPESCRLEVMIEGTGEIMQDNTLWTYAEDVDHLVDSVYGDSHEVQAH